MSGEPRVTCVVNSLAAGGAERAMSWLSSGLASSGCRVTLLTVFPESSDHYRVGAGVTRVVAPDIVASSCPWWDVPRVLQRLTALQSAILATAPDVVISFVCTLNVEVLMALAGRDVPAIVSERVYPPLHEIGARWQLLRSIMYPGAASVVVQTRRTGDWARSRWPRWRVTEIPNAVDRPGEESSPRPAWFGRRNVVSMGRMFPQKNHALLLSAFSKVAASHPDWHLTIVGDGPERPNLQARADALGLGPRFHMPGISSNPWSWLRHADLFVLSSDFEGFPNVLVEAMAHGLPVISTDCPAGPAEIVRDRLDGRLVPTGDVDRMAAELDETMRDEDVRRRMGAEAAAVCERFDSERIIGQWRTLIDTILS